MTNVTLLGGHHNGVSLVHAIISSRHVLVFRFSLQQMFNVSHENVEWTAIEAWLV